MTSLRRLDLLAVGLKPIGRASRNHLQAIDKIFYPAPVYERQPFNVSSREARLHAPQFVQRIFCGGKITCSDPRVDLYHMRVPVSGAGGEPLPCLVRSPDPPLAAGGGGGRRRDRVDIWGG